MSLHPKVVAGGVAGALATLILGFSGGHLTQAEASAIATLVIVLAGFLKSG